MASCGGESRPKSIFELLGNSTPMTDTMATLSIGDFSLITRLTVKALRFYEEKGLLVPARKEITGYRWYTFEQIPDGMLLRRLSDLGFGVQDMAEVLGVTKGKEEPARLDAVIRRRLAEVEAQIGELRSVRGRLEKKDPLEVIDLKDEEPIVKELAAMRVVAKRGRGTYQEVIPRLISEGCAMIFGQQNGQARINGPPIVIYLDQEYKEKDAEMEVALPVTGRLAVDPGFEVKNLPAVKVVSAIHKGPYGRVGETWGKVFKYVGEKGLKPTGPGRELYISDPKDTPPEELLTEVQIPIE